MDSTKSVVFGILSKTNICRVCFEETSEMFNLRDTSYLNFNFYSEEILLKDVLETVTGIPIECDLILPQYICSRCHDSVLSFYTFRMQFRTLHKSLNSCLKNLHQSIDGIKDSITAKQNIVINLKHEKLYKYIDKVKLKKVKIVIPVKVSNETIEELNEFDLEDNIINDKIDMQCHYMKVGKKNCKRDNYIGKLFTCRYCNGRYATAILARLHIRRIHKKVACLCSACGEHFDTKEELEDHEKVQHCSFSKLCQKCGMSVSNKFLEKHLQMCINYKPEQQRFICDYCNRSWKTKPQLYSHIYGNHLFEKPFKCKICDKGFSTKAYLKGHGIVHTRERRWSCDLCAKRFVDKKALKLHIRLHTGEKPYPCSLCDERFVDSSRRTSHIQKKHMDKNFSCPACGMRFHTKSTMTAHRRKVHEKVKKNIQEKSDQNCESLNIISTEEAMEKYCNK